MTVEKQLEFIYNLDLVPRHVIYVNSDDNDIINQRKKTERSCDVKFHLQNFNDCFHAIQLFMLNYERFRSSFVDSRLGVSDMVESVLNRLAFLNVKVVYNPLSVFPYGIPPSFRQILHPSDTRRNLFILQGTNKVLPYIRWRKTSCGIFCPVQIYNGFLRRGKIEFATRFLSFTYLSYNETYMHKLIAFPKKYIFTRVPCRIAIIGPNRVGKTTIAKLFSIIYNAQVYNTKQQVVFLSQIYSKNWSEIAAKTIQEAAETAQAIHDKFLVNREIYHQELEDIILELLEQIVDLDLKDSLEFPKEELSEMYNYSLYELVYHQLIYDKLKEELTKQKTLTHDFTSWLKIMEVNEESRKIQWIIDDAPYELTFWEKLPPEYLPNMVIFLSNTSEEKYREAFSSKLNAKFCQWKKVLENIPNYYDYAPKFEASGHYDLFKVVKNFRNDQHLKRYFEVLAKRELERAEDLEVNYKVLKTFLTKNEVEFIDFDIQDAKSRSDCNESILRKYFHTICDFCNDFSEDFFKSYQIPTSIEQLALYSEENLLEVQEEEEEEESNKSIGPFDEDYIQKNFGQVYDYCPVTYKNEGFLVRGYPETSIIYRDKIFYMHSQSCLDQFKLLPSKYSFRLEKLVPPLPAVFVIGINHGLKRTFASLIAQGLQVKTFTYQKMVERYYIDYNVTDDVTIEGQTELFQLFGEQFIGKELKELFTAKGFILTGYPFLEVQFDIMIKNRILPEVIFVMDDKDYLTAVLYEIINVMMTKRESITTTKTK